MITDKHIALVAAKQNGYAIQYISQEAQNVITSYKKEDDDIATMGRENCFSD